VLAEFSERLERQLAGAPEAEEGAPAAEGEAMDLGAMLSESRLGRYARVAVPVLAVLALLVVLVRRR
jgi:hypothetical protein